MAPTDARSESFPVLIEHQYGATTVPKEPQRIVSLSFIGHDFLLALGRPPHALRKWFGPHPYGVWPWAQEALGEAKPIVMQGEIDIEAIAAMQPDLIVGQWSGMTKREYQLLSRIAPTVPPQTQYGDYGTPWQAMLQTLGHATGRRDQAEDIIAALDARFQDIRQAHPDWQGARSVMVWAGQNGAYSARDIRGQFIEALGFKVPEAINTMASFNNYYVLIPPEDLSPIDVDALIWLDAGGSVSRLERMPLRPTLRAYGEGREIYADVLLSAALSHSSPLSLNYALDHLVPLLEAAMDGDPASAVASTAKAGLLPEGF
ncbi:ABC transporter substrate-binding protein [Pseudophaeobacter sp.]|uniref:ABC transporter substrate-binding protein n=1 Tax=Pseudophaeobacter sp. TaxID=1971739 RepID=UPI0040599C21